MVIWPLRGLAWLALELSDTTEVRMQLEEQVAWWRRHGGADGFVWLLPLLSALVSAEGDGIALARLIDEQRELVARLGNSTLVTRHIELFALLALDQGQPSRAARLLGFEEASASHAPPPMHRPLHAHTLAGIHAALSPAEFATQWDTGRALTLEQAVAEALASTELRSPADERY